MIKRKLIAVLFLLSLFVSGPARTRSDAAQVPGEAAKIRSFEELDRAIADTRERIRANPNEASAYSLLGRRLMMNGLQSEAERELQKALSLEPDNLSALIVLARLYRLEYRFDQEQTVLAKALSLAPQDPEVRLLAAGFDLVRMDFDKAAAGYRAVVDQDPRSAAGLCGLAEVAYWQNRVEDSQRFIGQCLAVDPEFGRAYLLDSLIHRTRQENDEWKEAGRKAVDAWPLDDEARANVSNILMRGEKKFEEGYEQAKIALRINPLCFTAHNSIGNGWTPKAYGPEKAEGLSTTELLIKKLLDEGSAALTDRRLDQADRAFDEVLQLAPDTIRAVIGKGAAEYHRRRFVQSLAWFRQALALNPDYGLAHYGVAQSLLRLKDGINVRLAGIEKALKAGDAPEPPGLGDVFINYGQLEPSLQKIIRLSVKPLRSFLRAAKDKGATFYITPFHMLQSEAPGMSALRDKRTFDGRLWDDVKGLGGLRALSGEDWEGDVRNLRFNVVSHEFAHQVHGLAPPELRDEIKRLFLKAKEQRLTLDFYADFNELEYLATGVEAYVSEEKLADQKITYGHTRRELLDKDPDLYRLIERLDRLD